MARVDLDLKQVRNAAMGPAIKLVSRACRRVENEAKRTVRVDTGRLRSSLGTKMRVWTWQVRGQVGSRVRYSLVEHNGAKRHMIFPRRKKALRFYWKKMGQVVILGSVNHPGTSGSFYLTTPMIRNLPQMGFRVERYRDASSGPGSVNYD